MKTAIVLLLLYINLFAGGITTRSGIYIDTDSMDTPEVKAKIQSLIEKLNYEHFIESIEIDFTSWGTCGSANFGIPGVTGCYDEPIIMADYSKEPLKIQSIGVSLNNDVSRSGYTRKSQVSSNIRGHVNFIKFPFVGIVIDSDFLCMTKGDLAVVYLSDYDPLYDGMYTRQAFKDIEAFFKPHLLLLGAVDCMSSSIDNFTGALSTTTAVNAKIRMSMPFNLGCWNAFPMGGYSTQADPIVGAATSISFGLAMSMRIGGIGKTMMIKGMDGSALPKTMCGEKVSPLFVKPQFMFQLVEPSTSSVVPLGAMASEWAEFKNTGETADESVFWIWQRKCLYMGAAKCSK